VQGATLGPQMLETKCGLLPEMPMSLLQVMGKRFSVFGGGYFRLAPRKVIELGIQQLVKQKQPLVVYLHPREIDPEHPRLALSPVRRFKSYVNLKTTLPKLQWLCQHYTFCTMGQMIDCYLKNAPENTL